jgi:NTP pyrophosphatase (non-canonical NTP hydrolase)
MKFEDIIDAIKLERIRQDNKWGTPRDLPDRTWLTILVEEVGEIAKATLEHDETNLREEIIQVAAVCISWLENRK